MAGQSELFRRDVKQGEEKNFLYLQMACVVEFFVVSWGLFVCLFFVRNRVWLKVKMLCLERKETDKQKIEKAKCNDQIVFQWVASPPFDLGILFSNKFFPLHCYVLK